MIPLCESSVSTHYCVHLGIRLASSGGGSIAIQDDTSATSRQAGGDIQLLVRNRGVLIEFKRELAGWVQEAGKPGFKRVSDYIRRNTSVGRRCHWFAWRDSAAPGGDQLMFARYLNLIGADHAEHVSANALGLTRFLELQLMPDGSAVGAELEAFEPYVRRLASIWKGSDDGGDSVSNAELLFMSIDADGYLHSGVANGWADPRLVDHDVQSRAERTIRAGAPPPPKQ